jgi:hypothetical protein
VDWDWVIGRFAPDNLFPPDQFTASGVVEAVDLAAQDPTLSVVGGIGRYFAAQGSITANTFEANITGAPNFTTDFHLVKRDG